MRLVEKNSVYVMNFIEEMEDKTSSTAHMVNLNGMIVSVDLRETQIGVLLHPHCTVRNI